MRIIYAVLIAILLILGIIAIFSGGGSNKTHSGSAGNGTAHNSSPDARTLLFAFDSVQANSHGSGASPGKSIKAS